MKLKLFATLLLVAVFSNFSIVAATLENVDKNTNGTTSVFLTPVNKVLPNLVNRRGVINGNENPALIPDSIAYSLLFRFIAGNQDIEAKNRIRHYIRQMGLGECRNCNGGAEGRGTERDLEIFIAEADEFQRRVTTLDQQVAEIKRNNQPSPQVRAILTQLQLQKEAIVAEIIASLPNKLTRAGMNKVLLHINERVKRNSIMQTEQISASSFSQFMKTNPEADETGGQAEYTDAYSIEQSRPIYTDPQTGEEATPFSEGATSSQIVGVGITESSYESDVFMVDTYTTIAVPSGAIISQSPVVVGDTYARAETIATLDTETAEEGEYTAKSRHRYKHDSGGFLTAGYNTLERLASADSTLSQLAPNSCGYGCGGFYYTTSFTFFRFRTYRQIETFQRAANFDWRCVQAHGNRFPFAYYPFCAPSPFNRCRVQGIACGSQQPARFIIANTLVTEIYGFKICPFTTFSFTPFEPITKCLNTN